MQRLTFMRIGFAVSAACLLVACHAVEGPKLDEQGLHYGPAPASTLVERRDLPFRLAQTQQGKVEMTVLAYQAPGGKPAPLAVMRASRAGDAAEVAEVAIQRLPLSVAPHESGDLRIAALEYLYTLVLRQDPGARYCLADKGRRCNGSRMLTHAGALRELARARQEAVDSAGRTGASVPWQVVTLMPVAIRPANADEVAVRVAGDAGPTAGATIFFNRAPHSSCMATSSPDGLASCRLVDQHGDDDAHDAHGVHNDVPVLATFPGVVRADRVWLPTTLMHESSQ